MNNYNKIDGFKPYFATYKYKQKWHKQKMIRTSQILPFIIQQLVISSSLQGSLKCLNLFKLNILFSIQDCQCIRSVEGALMLLFGVWSRLK